MTVADSLREAGLRLALTSDTPRLDAELLMAHAFEVERSEMLLRHMRDAVPEPFAVLIERRVRHEPVAYITGHQEFYGLDLAVTPTVLIPRADSETLIEAARGTFGDRAPGRILDLGAGSGALLLAALSLWPDADGIGTDCSTEALAVAENNAQRLGYNARFLLRDWTVADWASDLGAFDLILANPPYVEETARLEPGVRDWEPARALFAGPDGLDAYRVLIPQLPALLAPGGIAIVEIGATQADAVTALAARAGLAAVLHRDLAGRPRALRLSPG